MPVSTSAAAETRPSIEELLLRIDRRLAELQEQPVPAETAPLPQPVKLLENRYLCHSFPVACETGVFANSATGQRMVYDQENNTYSLYADSRLPKYVKKRLLKPICASVFDFDSRAKKLSFKVFRATAINKHGLNWTTYFEAHLTAGVGHMPPQNAPELDYWLNGPGASLLSHEALSCLDAPSGNQCFRLLFRSSPAQPISAEDIFRNWLDGTLPALIASGKIDDIHHQKFGIELEFTGISRKTAANVVAKFFKNRLFTSVQNTYSIYEKLSDGNTRTWTLTYDGSIRPERPQGVEPASNDEYMCEFVTPICRYDDIVTIQKLVRLLRRAGMKVNDSCGLHIHVDGSEHTPVTLRNLVNIVHTHEDLLYKALLVKDDRKNRWCAPARSTFIKLLNNTRRQDLCLSQIKNLWYSGYTGSRSRRYHSSRYQALNLHSFFSGKGVEFRLFNAVTHAGKVKAYIQLCLAINAAALRQSRSVSSSRGSCDDKRRMRSWLHQLGLTGDEFKTARLHLTSNLSDSTSSEAA